MYGQRRCWNTASSSNPLKRKNTSPLDLSKRLACHSINDVSQNSNLIDLRSTSELVYSSEFLPDHQSARTSDNHHSSSKKKNTSVSHSNHRIESSLIDRITLPFQNQNQTLSPHSNLFNSNKRYLSLPAYLEHQVLNLILADYSAL
ncbi:hypothetical protein PSTG_06155 [Puccinia striiformis f. sp. tritici PST-78]|uniref:Uncharacterized protein n=1 Tax=Puccinia striiformis f. sp. tritici PST-78 TaxID=1165861 RepID=A0A0L0VNA2_9BASI|nr:hypothetical protein PSTG_06155 [Puccinia striiformis f. sp. tritici PST-78]